MKKRFIAVLMAGALLMGMLTGCGSGDTTSQNNNSSANSNTEIQEGSTAEETAEVEKVVMSFLVFNLPSEENEVAVEEAINAITRDKIGVEVDFMLMDGASYVQQTPLMLVSAEQFDIFSTLGLSYTSMVNGGYALNLEENDYLQTYGQDIIDIMDKYLDSCRVNGTLYGLPHNCDAATPNGWCIVSEYLDAIGYEYDAENTNYIAMDELENIFAQLHEAFPEKTVFVEQEVVGTSILNDYIGGDWFGTLMDPENSLEVTDFFSTDEYMDYCKLHYKWNQLGYISADALTDDSTWGSIANSGKGLSCASGIKPGIISQMSAEAGRSVAMFQTNDEYIMTSSAMNSSPWCINSNTEVPEACIKLLNELYVNPDLADLITYGIEGTDYVANEEGLYTYPEGQDASTVYHPNITWLMPNEFIAGVWEGNPASVWTETEELNNNAIMSKAMGFTFDNSALTAEYSALNNIYLEYRRQLEYGFLDPEEGIPEMVDRMKSAGLDEYIAEKQSQLNAWAAANGVE